MTQPRAAEIAAILRDPAMAKPARDFPVGQENIDEAGLYAWHAGDAGRELLAETYGVVFPSLIYAGQAGATSTKAGVERGTTLLSRIRGNHLGGNIKSSTFRKTLAASLFDPLGLALAGPSKLETASNQAISVWMRAHLSLATVACPDRATLSELEDAVLLELDPPLNLMGMSRTPVRTELKARRARLGKAP
jgi:hypothetical protein